MKRNEGIYATPAQEAYLNRLWAQVAKYGSAEWLSKWAPHPEKLVEVK